MNVPITHYTVPNRVLKEARVFFRARGAERHEGTALLAGHHLLPGAAVITRLVIPDQIAETTAWGARVDLTPEAHYTLTDLLLPGENYFARIHSHPGRAYHSERDDANQILTHQGAISIVVPNFARDPIVLTCCAVYRLEHGRGWLPLDGTAIEQLFTTVEEVL